MNRDLVEGKWVQLKGQVQELWGRLTDDQCEVVAGKREQLRGKVQQRHGMHKEEADRQLQEFRTRNRHWNL